MQGSTKVRMIVFISILSFFVVGLILISGEGEQNQSVSKATTTAKATPTPTIPNYQNPFGLALGNGITYPINQLGNCADSKDCYRYCSLAQNTPACWSYGTFILHRKVLGAATTLGNNQKETLNCEADEACRAYCQMHPTKCPGFASTDGPANFPSNYLGPTGCRNEEECRSFCKAHPSACPGFPSNSQQPTYQLPTSTPPPTPGEQSSQ